MYIGILVGVKISFNRHSRKPSDITCIQIHGRRIYTYKATVTEQ